MTYEELLPDNIPHATTLSLYRERARNIRAAYERMWRCFAGNLVTEFMYESREGDGDDASRMKNLRDYVNSHVRVIENLRIRVMRCAEAAKRWKKSNRSGRTLVKKICARSQVVFEELIRREKSGALFERNAEATTAPFYSGSDRQPGASAVVRELCVEATTNVWTLAEAAVPTHEQEKRDSMAEEDRRHHRRLGMEEAVIQKAPMNDRIITSRTRAYE